MRRELALGTIITLHSDGAVKQFHIDQVIGSGASCIAYEAHQVGGVDHNKRFRIKECYPYGMNVSRENDGLTLIWGSDGERNKAFSLLKKAHELILLLRNDDAVGNNVTSASLFEGNGTLYSVMEVNHALTYDHVHEENLSCILETVLTLTKVVGNLHDQGYLHLDIKPSNFLVTHKPNTNVWLFDVDSLTSMQELSEGVVRYAPYSSGWAAPEQLLRRVDQLCPATDLYAIGAILFEKVMGHPVTNDDMGISAKWQLDNRLFDEVNPAVKRSLCRVFQKTLAASSKRRYQTASELIEELEQACQLVSEPYLISDYPESIISFIGREEELAIIKELFHSGKHIVFIRGIGGIGKSEIAKRYIQLHKNEYDSIHFCTYNESISDILDCIEIHNFEGNANEQKKQLKRLLNKHTLLVIDGFDNENDPDFEVLSRLRCDVLITSRLDWEEYSQSVVCINELSKTEQMDLFECEYGNSLAFEEKHIISELLQYVEGYTLIIPLIAKQLRKGVCGFREMLEKVVYGGIKEASLGKVRHIKDDALISGTVYGILSRVLNVASFTDEEAYVMRSMALLNQYRLDQNDFMAWIGKENDNIIDDLIFGGWIQREYSRGASILTMHAVIADLCYEELKPTILNCLGIAERIWRFANNFEQFYKAPLDSYFGGYAQTYIPAHVEYQYDSFMPLMWDILKRSDWSDAEGIMFWIRIIEKISNVIHEGCEIFEPFLEYIFDISMNIDNFGFPRISEAALAMEAIAIQREDFSEAQLYAEIALLRATDCVNADEIVFRVCFSLYQHICCLRSRFEEYWNGEGFEEFSIFIKEIWEENVEYAALELSENNVGVLIYSDDGECNVTIDQANRHAYEDFCFLISQEGKQQFLDFMNPDYDESEEAYFAEKQADEESERVDERDELLVPWFDYNDFVKAIETERKVNALLRGEAFTAVKCWVLMSEQSFTDEEKAKLNERLLEIDPQLPTFVPPQNKRYMVLYDFAKMEAALSYAYAVAGNMEMYRYHVRSLLQYYRVLIYGRATLDYFKYTGIGDINTHLPGAASLLNKYGTVLPDDEALVLMNSIVSIMEQYHREQHFDMSCFFEVYQMGLELARKAHDTEMISHYEKRLKIISGVYFEKKEELKTSDDEEETDEFDWNVD